MKSKHIHTYDIYGEKFKRENNMYVNIFELRTNYSVPGRLA